VEAFVMQFWTRMERIRLDREKTNEKVLGNFKEKCKFMDIIIARR